MAYKIVSVEGNKRLSTQQLLQKVYDAIADGETEFDIEGNGQHDLGGAVWVEGKELKFNIKNPGQRVGAFCMKGTTIVVEGSAPADIGWLCSGGEIIVKGDGGDTSGHCAATGKIYIGGRVGTRSGSLMKHDPAYSEPELWILKNTGSFSFEFMGGGKAIVCGIGCEDMDSVLGDRPCIGMVNGTVYFRGNVQGIPSTSKIVELDAKDIEFLEKNIPVYLDKIDQPEHMNTLMNMPGWKKIVVKTAGEKRQAVKKISMGHFRSERWVEGGIFGDIYEDDYQIANMVNRGANRLRIPEWYNQVYAAPCEDNCPVHIPTQLRFNLIREDRAQDAFEKVLEFSPFPGSVCGSVCPNMCMDACTRCYIDKPANIRGLGLLSAEINIDKTSVDTGKKIAVIGGGVGGLTTAWLLRLRGHDVTVYDRNEDIGGKIVHSVSRERLDTKVIESEIERIKSIGIKFKTNTEVDEKLYAQLKKDNDFVVLAIGAYQSKIPPWPGKEKVYPYLEFLKDINAGKTPNIGKKVVVIGCGNSGMDVVFGAYKCGVEKVTALDVQKPAAFEDEIEHAKKLGTEFMWPAFTTEITDKGVTLKDGTFIEADTVFVAIGEVPVFDGLFDKPELDRGYLKTEPDLKIDDNVYAIGDVTKLGLLAAAIGNGREVALRIHAQLTGTDYVEPKRKIDHDKLTLGYFRAQDTKPYDESPADDSDRCISCGTCRDCHMCENACPEKAITRIEDKENGTFEYVSDPDLCIGCGICAGVCPCGIWTMEINA